MNIPHRFTGTTKWLRLGIVTAALAQFLLTGGLWAQGNLAPAGAPAPTMKTLAQIEARTPIATAPMTISAPGSYYLTSNISVTAGNAITITADNVALDLNGFSISSTASPAAGTAILLSGGRQNIHIHNGAIAGSVTYSGGTFSGAGFANAIVGTGADPVDTRVSKVSVSGCSGAGIYLGQQDAATLVDSCNVQTVGGQGIVGGHERQAPGRGCLDARTPGAQGEGGKQQF